MNTLPIKNYEGFYSISANGDIYSLDRTIIGTDGVKYFKKGQKIKCTSNKQTNYYQVSFWKDNKGTWLYLHRLLAEHFIKNPLNKPEVNHIDGNRQNNCLSNLEWVTSKENSQHAIKTGLITYTNRLTRDEFITCLQDVINGESYKSLSQRVPYKVPFLSTKIRQIAKEIGLENELNESLYQQKLKRAVINGINNRKYNN